MVCDGRGDREVREGEFRIVGPAKAGPYEPEPAKAGPYIVNKAAIISMPSHRFWMRMFSFAVC